MYFRGGVAGREPWEVCDRAPMEGALFLNDSNLSPWHERSTNLMPKAHEDFFIFAATSLE